ncbi:MAG TPA: tetratricopeptide repeat protein [Polyangiaceae bacterium]|jgi:tetratricopeptide (TPR) repeat protein|nr:tetratricopeptide repeat protein [Polyangiaceae bacterium]
MTIAGAWSVSPAAQAQEASSASELYERGKKLFESGDFRGALQLFKKAYAMDPHPVLIYNIARSHESLGELEGAIEAFEKYLELDPKAPDRGAVEQRIATLKRQLEERQALEARARQAEKPRPPPKPEPEPEPEGPSPIPWIIAGVGVAGVGAGVAMGAVAQARFDAAVEEQSAERAQGLEDEAHSLALGANIAFAIGGAIALGGAIAGIVNVVQTTQSAGLVVRLGAGTIGLTHRF